MAEKRYYWLKLKEDFFSNLHIKKLRKLAGGDTYTIIYLKMQLLSLKSNGVLTYEYIEDDFASELALLLDEDEENVRVVLLFLERNSLIERTYDASIILCETVENTGSEGGSAKRMRELRAKQNLEIPSQCDKKVTLEKEIEKEIRDKNICSYSKVFKEPLPETPESDLKTITDAWNSVPCTVSITGINPMTKRYDETKIVIGMFGLDGVLEAIRKIAESEYLSSRGGVVYDRFMNRNSIQNVLEGSYDRDFNKKESLADQMERW